MKLIEKPFIFIRHGETEYNKQRTAQGQIDVPLNAYGIEQVHAAAKQLSQLEFATICCSPLRRAHHTAELIAQDRLKEVVVIDDLAECCLGARQGTYRGEWFDEWRAGTVTPEGAETYDVFLDRALRGVNRALSYDSPLLIVAHGGIFWAIEKFAPLVGSISLPNAVPVYIEPPDTSMATWRMNTLLTNNA